MSPSLPFVVGGGDSWRAERQRNYCIVLRLVAFITVFILSWSGYGRRLCICFARLLAEYIQYTSLPSRHTRIHAFMVCINTVTRAYIQSVELSSTAVF